MPCNGTSAPRCLNCGEPFTKCSGECIDSLLVFMPERVVHNEKAETLRAALPGFRASTNDD